MPRPGPTGPIRVIAGRDALATTCRWGATDMIEVRLRTATGDYALAKLPRETVSTTVDRSLLLPGVPPVWDDAHLPPVGTPLHAKPAANAGAGRAAWDIDGTTLRPNA